VDYLIDPRKNWSLAEEHLAQETDPRRRQILETLVAHAKAEAAADFPALMTTVSPRAHYRSYAAGSEAANRAQSPEGKEGVTAYYSAIVESGCHFIEHAVERMAVGRDTLTTEGELKMAYPGGLLGSMQINVPDPEALYLYQQRLLIVWGFDEAGLVLCEDSYSGGGAGFEGIAQRPVHPAQIYRVGGASAG
jgi:hypothetical protein